MDIQPLYTKIDKTIQTLYGLVVLEDPNGFPRNEANLYCLTPTGKFVWRAEKPEPGTLYSRVRLADNGATLSTYTTGGHACDLEPGTGRILSKASIQ
jgi:hypothetical protein